MENILNQEYTFAKPKIKNYMRYPFLLGAFFFAWIIIDDLWVENGSENIGLLLFNATYMITFLLLTYDTFQKNYLVIKDGVFKTSINFYTKFSFHLSEVAYIDRHFDEWTIVLKNTKKHVFSDQVIQGKDKAIFKEFMNALPKKYPDLRL